MEIYPVVIVSFSLIISVWNAKAINIESCCSQPDIQLIAVNCTNGTAQWQWESAESQLGFSVKYNCNLDANATKCGSSQEKAYDRFNTDDLIQEGRIYTEIRGVAVPFNATCCFWVVDKDKVVDVDDDGCSRLKCCNTSSHAESFIALSSSSASYDYSTHIDPVLIPVNTTAASGIATFSTPLNNSSQKYAITSDIRLSLNISSSLTPTISSTSVPTSTQITQTLNITDTPTVEISSSIERTSSSVNTKIAALVPAIIFSCVVVFMVLLLTSCLLVYWKKSKHKQLEISVSAVKAQIDNHCEDSDVTLESESEVEVIPDFTEDSASITDDISYSDMYEKILRSLRKNETRRRTSLDSSPSSSPFVTDSESDHDNDNGIADMSGSSHYCYNNGSAGDCSQSNSSSQRTSCTSATPLSTDI